MLFDLESRLFHPIFYAKAIVVLISLRIWGTRFGERFRWMSCLRDFGWISLETNLVCQILDSFLIFLLPCLLRVFGLVPLLYVCVCVCIFWDWWYKIEVSTGVATRLRCRWFSLMHVISPGLSKTKKLLSTNVFNSFYFGFL